jgi:tripartite-type tricarboxylate transporter receptor subunit TctC
VMRHLFISLFVVVLAAMQPAAAEDYPSRPVTIVAPAAPGGLYSLFARLIGNKLEQKLGKPFVVENHPGASSIVGVQFVLRAPHDGYTLMVANNTGVAVNVSMVKNLPYDPAKDLVPVALIATIPEALVVNAALPVQSIADLADLARKTPGGLSYGSPGAGTGPHLSGVLLGSTLGAPFVHVPYKGMSPAINDLAGGHIAFMFSPIPPAAPLAAAGKIRMLALNSRERLEAIPQVPTLSEVGLKSFEAGSWFMLVAAQGTPPDIVDRLYREANAIIGDAEVRAEFTRLGLVAVRSPPPAELKGFISAEIARWGEIVKKAGLVGAE